MTRLLLQRGDEGPVWKVTLRAAKLQDSSRDVDIGSVYINCADGKVVRNDLNINRVD